jgi:drug/metabolite transporter (DMT)-like permease
MLVAVGAALVATFGYAIGLSYARRRFPGVAPTTIAFGQLAAASVILAPGALLTLPSVASVEAVGAVVALGFVSTAFAWPLLFRLAARVGPTATSTVTFLAPVFGVAWGALLLGEPIGPGLAVGAALVLTSLTLVFGVRLPRAWRPAPAAA